jgi:hypothetical protein
MLLALSTGGSITARADGEVLKTVAAAAGKSFTIKCARGYWYAYGKGNYSNVIAGSKGDLTSVDGRLDFKDLTTTSKFTIVEQTKSDNTKRYYLYSLDTKKWVVTNGSYLGLADKPYEGDSISFIASTGTSKANYPTCIYFAGNENNMYGVSYAYTPDVFKYHNLGDEGNMSVVTESGTLENATYQTLQNSLNETGFYVARTISASPIADAADFNGLEGKAYLIHNVSGGRNGYLHVDADENLTYQGIPGDHADLTNFIFTTEKSGENIYLKNGNNRYIPNRTTSSQKFNTIADNITGAGVATVVAKNGYKATTFNFKIDGHYMNVNPEGVVVTYDVATDINGVWEFMPVDNNDFTTTNIVRHITIQNGVRLDGGSVTYSSDNTNSSARKYRIGQHIYFPTTVDFLSGGLSENAVATNTNTTIAVTERLPFEVITAGKDTVWYNLNLRNNSSPKWMSATSSGSVTLSTTFTDNNYSQWAFKGSSVSGIQLYNKGLGTTYTLKGTTTPTLTTASGNNNFIIAKNGTDGFTLRTGRAGNNCFNDVNNTFSYWNTTYALTDDGSTFRVFLPKGFYTMLNYQKATGADAAYGYLGLPADANNKTNVMGNDATVSLNDVVYIAPASAPSSSTVDPRYVTMQLQGKNIQGVSASTQVTVGDNKVSFMVTRPNVGYFAFGSAVSNATPNTQSYLHTANSQSYQVVGWSTDAVATSWQVSPAGAITMTATQVGGKYYATFYAPFAVKLSGAKAYTLTLNTDKTSATLNEVQLTNSILPKESAVLIIADGTNYTVEPVIDATEKVSSILTGVSLAESWSNHENDLVLGQIDGKIGFYKWGTDNTLKNNRCYLPATELSTAATAKGVVIDFGTVTGINAATLQPAKTDGKIYNLQGQEVSRSYKGVVIKNGRKVMQ